MTTVVATDGRARGARHLLVTAGALLATLAFAHRARAQTAPPSRMDDDPVTPRMMALGGRAEAVSSSTSALFGNPAAITGTRSYSVDTYGLYDPSVNRYSFGSAVIDSTRSFVAAGFSYIYNDVADPLDPRRTPGGPAFDRSGHDARLTVSLPVSNVFGIGATGRYLNITAGPLAPAPRSDTQTVTTLSDGAWGGFTFDAGLYLKPVPSIMLSATGRNLNNPSTTAAPIGTGFGLAVAPFPIFTLVADCLLDYRLAGVTRGRYSGGAELFIADRIAIRAGYAYDDIRNNQSLTAGLGYIDPHFALEISARQEIVPELQTTMMLSLRYFYQPQQQ